MTTIHHGFSAPSLDGLEDAVQLVVVDFSASWCGPCKRYDPVFQRVAQDMVEAEPDAPVAFLSVDVDENKALSQRMSVKSVPMTVLMVYERGLLWGHRWSEKARLAGVIPYPRLQSAIQEHLVEA